MTGTCVAHLGHRGVLRLGFYLSEGSSVALLPVVDQLACDQAECLSLLSAEHEKSKGGKVRASHLCSHHVQQLAKTKKAFVVVVE